MSTLVGPGSDGHKPVVFTLHDRRESGAVGSPHPLQNHDEPSVTMRFALAPTDWYMLPMSSLSGSFNGAWFQSTVVSSGSV